MTSQALQELLVERVRLLSNESTLDLSNATRAVVAAVAALATEGLLKEEAGLVELTAEGKKAIEKQAGQAQLIRDQFSASLHQRALALHPQEQARAVKVANACEAFL